MGLFTVNSYQNSPNRQPDEVSIEHARKNVIDLGLLLMRAAAAKIKLESAEPVFYPTDATPTNQMNMGQLAGNYRQPERQVTAAYSEQTKSRQDGLGITQQGQDIIDARSSVTAAYANMSPTGAAIVDQPTADPDGVYNSQHEGFIDSISSANKPPTPHDGWGLAA